MTHLTVLAHPLIEPGGLPVPPLAVATAAVLAVVVVAARPRMRQPEQRPEPAAPAPRALPRALGLAALALAIATGLWGRNVVTDNLAPALVVGVGWPLLVLASVVGAQVWDRLNPWDTLARLLGPLAADPGETPVPADVRWAAPAAAGLVWYLAAFRGALLPDRVGLALAVYTVATLAGCLALGRAAWLGRAEIVTITLGWFTRVGRRRLAVWTPPRGADVVLGLLCGGFVFAMLRYSTLFAPLISAAPRLPAETIGLAGVAALAVALLWAAERRCAAASFAGTAVAACVPVAAGLALAAAMVRGQLLLAVQVLPTVAGDPFGRGWDLLRTAGWVPHPNPLGDTLHTAVQVGLVAVGGLAGAATVRARTWTPDVPGGGRGLQARTAATIAVALLVAAGVLAVSAV